MQPSGAVKKWSGRAGRSSFTSLSTEMVAYLFNDIAASPFDKMVFKSLNPLGSSSP